MKTEIETIRECIREINDQVRRIETHPMNQGNIAPFLNGGQAHFGILQLRTVAARLEKKISEIGSE